MSLQIISYNNYFYVQISCLLRTTHTHTTHTPHTHTVTHTYTHTHTPQVTDCNPRIVGNPSVVATHLPTCHGSDSSSLGIHDGNAIAVFRLGAFWRKRLCSFDYAKKKNSEWYSGGCRKEIICHTSICL